MTILIRLETAADMMEAIGSINVPVPILELRRLIEIAKKEAKQ